MFINSTKKTNGVMSKNYWQELTLHKVISKDFLEEMNKTYKEHESRGKNKFKDPLAGKGLGFRNRKKRLKNSQLETGMN